MENCVFCKIVRGEIPTEFVYQDEEIAVFNDVKPQANTHLLIIPKKHFLDLNDAPDEIVLKIKNKILELTKEMKSYRIIINGGAVQEIKHLHFHLLGEVVT
ncbi:HIT domain-containing protein [Candidatus Gottesmanbacteria bacterium]|nr:HIT domain-containing protein [Candidatus Gottesmanbacteria bacterium]